MMALFVFAFVFRMREHSGPQNASWRLLELVAVQEAQLFRKEKNHRGKRHIACPVFT